MSSRNFKIPILVAPSDRLRLKKIRLFVSKDCGENWEKVASVSPDEDYFYYVDANDGLYWFTVQIVDNNDSVQPQDIRTASPKLKVRVQAASADGLLAPQAIVPGAKETQSMTQQQASFFAPLALKGIKKEYPNKPADVLNNDKDIISPRAMHPAFYGCYDWHSSVHGHWMLVRLLRLYQDLPEKQQIRALLAENLTTKNLQAEADYFARANSQSFERPYGWAWLLKLAEELHGWDDPDGKAWSKNLQPLVDVIVARYLAFFPKQTYPIRTGVHPNTAFGLSFALDYARIVGNKPLQALVEERSRAYFAKDAGIPAAWEPDGADFFSPSLMEADLMRRVLPPGEFPGWLHGFYPDLAKGEPKSLLVPATVTDRSDPQLVHLDGLNLSRAWCMRSIAEALPKNDPARTVLAESAARHAEAGLRHVASGDYVGEHWLASFAVYLFSTPSPE
ncbi:MAG TPA: DUF2891 domain-containing protein [Gemmataceae bacterium]|nr:DUF2891 domain-containing protein [Gemmataceae bacterium]